jgi:hypothetical protein
MNKYFKGNKELYFTLAGKISFAYESRDLYDDEKE